MTTRKKYISGGVIQNLTTPTLIPVGILMMLDCGEIRSSDCPGFPKHEEVERKSKKCKFNKDNRDNVFVT